MKPGAEEAARGSGRGGRPARPAGGVRLILAVAVPTVLATGTARLWAERSLGYGEPVPLVGDLFRLTLGENAGVAFGLLRGSPLVPWLAVLALVAFALYLARPLSRSRAGGVSLGLIFGGGLTNLIDRIGDGRVTDYLDFGVGAWRWPTSNLPDVAITIGFLLVVWVLARGEQMGEDAPSGPVASPLITNGMRSLARRDEED